MTATILAAPPAAPAPAAPRRATRGPAPRLLAPLTGREGALAVLDGAYSCARDTGCEVHTALLLPRTPFGVGAAPRARPGEDDREEDALVELALQRAAAAGVPARISVHRLRGLRGRRRERVLDRAVARLARRLDAVPVGWTAP